MSTIEAPTRNDSVYCNHCGTANPARSVVCCNCGHVHARTIKIPEFRRTYSMERWFWIVLRLVLGLVLCINRALPSSGALLTVASLASIAATISIPVLFAALLGQGNWSRSSRWFLGAALALLAVDLFRHTFSHIHLH